MSAKSEGDGGAGNAGDGGGEKKRAAQGDFERQVEEIRADAAQVRENLATAERALEEAGVLRMQHTQLQQAHGAPPHENTQQQ